MLVEMGKKARSASRKLAQATTEQKNAALLTIADRLWSDRQEILSANQQDVLAARQAGLTDALLDRLSLDENRLQGIINDLRSVAGLTDPVGEIFDETSMPNGLQVHKQRVPIGVLGVIYEARPNVTVDVAGLALKSGNSVILRGGSETLHSNNALVKAIRKELDESSLPVDAVQLIDDPDRARVNELLKLHEYVDMIIPAVQRRCILSAGKTASSR